MLEPGLERLKEFGCRSWNWRNEKGLTKKEEEIMKINYYW